MKRDILESHGIYYEDDPAKSLANVVPPHFTALKGVLLDFTCTIQDRLCLDDDEDFSNISAITALSEGKNSQIEHNAMLDSIKMYRTKMTYAGMLNMGEDREAEWQRYYTDGFLIPLRDAMYPRETDSRRCVDVRPERLPLVFLMLTPCLFQNVEGEVLLSPF
jgi:hypothetical protein